MKNLKQIKAWLYALLISIIMLFYWIGLSRLFQYLNFWRWLDMLLTFILLPVLVWFTILLGGWLDKKYKLYK